MDSLEGEVLVSQLKCRCVVMKWVKSHVPWSLPGVVMETRKVNLHVWHEQQKG